MASCRHCGAVVQRRRSSLGSWASVGEGWLIRPEAGYGFANSMIQVPENNQERHPAALLRCLRSRRFRKRQTRKSDFQYIRILQNLFINKDRVKIYRSQLPYGGHSDPAVRDPFGSGRTQHDALRRTRLQPRIRPQTGALPRKPSANERAAHTARTYMIGGSRRPRVRPIQASVKMSRSRVSGTNNRPIITVATAMPIGYQRPK